MEDRTVKGTGGKEIKYQVADQNLSPVAGKSAGIGAAVVLGGLLFAITRGGHHGASHPATPGSSNAPEAQPKPSYSVSAPRQTKNTTAPKTKNVTQKPLVPTHGPGILNWPQTQETVAIDNVDLTAATPQKTLTFSDQSPKAIEIAVDDKVHHTETYLSIALPDMHNSNTVTIDGQQTETLGQTSEAGPFDGHIKIVTSGLSAYVLGVEIVP